MDLKYLEDADKKNHVALSMVDAGTSWHMAILLKNRKPKHVIGKVTSEWIAHYGVPNEVVIDQGGEFEAEFIATCEEFGVDTRCVGSHAPWQHGLAERHGSILGTIWDKLVHQFGTAGSRKAKALLAVCCQAKNATITRNGLTPEQAVFGRSLRWTESANADEDEYLLAALGSDGAAWKASQMRSAARIALLERDACDKVRRAMMRQAPTVIGEICPGTRIYLWSPHPMKGRMREDVHR